MRTKQRRRQRKQDRRTQIRELKEQGHWDPVGAIHRIEEIIKQRQEERRKKEYESKR
ncbi:hypothetical protein ES703_70294 [subsurface metagenome]